MMMFKKILLLLFLLIPNCVFSQDKSIEKQILPKDTYFAPLFLDPIECIPFLGVMAYTETKYSPEKIYVPFSMAFQKILIRWQKDSLRGYEFGFDAGAFTQFEWITPNNKWQRNILNSDFKGSWFLNYKLNKQFVLRTRIYHISSHLGDDYLIRNKIHSYTPNPVNYEQLDFILSYTKNLYRYYGGFGMVIRPETIRKRFSTEWGFLYNKPLPFKKSVNFITGINIKIFAQNNYEPNIKFATGIRFGKIYKNPINLVLEYYQGHLPYSVYEYNRAKWLGISLYFNPI